jgi:hypothetical protein
MEKFQFQKLYETGIARSNAQLCLLQRNENLFTIIYEYK